MKKTPLDITEKRYTTSPPIIRIGIAAIFIYALMLIPCNLYRYYPDTKAGRADANEVVNQFIGSLNRFDYAQAYSLLSEKARQNISASTLGYGERGTNKQPISGDWEGYDKDKDQYYGTLTYNDGEQLRTEVDLIWYKGEYKISGLHVYNQQSGEQRIKFSFPIEENERPLLECFYWLKRYRPE